jgi:hypothetical protein
MRKIFSILFALVLVLSFSLVATAPAAADYNGFNNPDYYYAAVKVAPQGVRYCSAGFNPDGTQIIAQKRWYEGTTYRSEIVLMDADGSNEIIISGNDSGSGDINSYSSPFWSDDGTAIGFLEVHNANPNKVVCYDMSSSTRSYIYEPVTPLDVANCDFLGDSKTSIVFWDYGAGGNVADLFIWDGTTRTNITNSADYKEYEPISNADGTVIVYWSGETTAEPTDTTHTLTYSGGTWTKDVGFTPIADSYWAYWSSRSDNYICVTRYSTRDVEIYDSAGNFVMDLTGDGYEGGSGQWNFFGCVPEGPNGEFLITSNAASAWPSVSRDILVAAPRAALFVDDDGSDSNPGAEAAPFATIQKAINESVAGGTVNVAAGTYDEQVVITKSLTLQGAGNTTIIQPSSAATLTTVLDGLFWDGTTKNIAGIIVANVTGGSPVTIKNLKVDESLVTTKPSGADYLAGIFYRETGGTVDTVSIAGGGKWSGWDRGYGMYLSAGTNTVSVEVKGSSISNWDKNGIEVMGSGLTANIHNNILTGRGPLPNDDEVQNGVDVGRGATATVNDNTISDLGWTFQQWWSYGIIFGSANDCSANGNVITDCQAGIVFDNNNGSAQGNTIDGGAVGLQGLWAQYYEAGTWDVSFVDNAVSAANDDTYYGYENAAIGVQSWDAEALITATIDSNQLAGNVGTSADGISIGDFPEYDPAGSIAVNITRNTISGWQEGIRLISSVASGSVITSNTITGNIGDGSGIHIEAGIDAGNIVAHLNNIEDNEGYGIYNGGTGTLDATYNWWGSSSGPYHSTLNSDGTGNAVSDYVDFEPWLVVENPTVTTQAATSITTTTATLNMSFTVGGYGSVNVRFAYKKSSDTTWTNTTWVPKTADGTYAAPAIGLSSNTQYDFRAQLKYEDAEFDETTLNGTTRQFTTLRTVPTVTTQAATDVVLFHAILHMSYTVGDFSPVQVRFAYKKSAGTEWSYTAWVSKSGDGTHSAQIILLVASATQYDFKAQLKYDGTVIAGTTTLHFTTAIISGCFIATAAYGTPTAKQIDVLREFRDEVLLKNAVGSQFVELYYRYSPPVAEFIAGHEAVRTLVRELVVDPIVWVVEAAGNMWRN